MMRCPTGCCFHSGTARLQQSVGRQLSTGNPTSDLIGVTEQSGSIPGLCYRAGSWQCNSSLNSGGWISANTWHADISYVTGSHNVKIGYNGLYDYDNQKSDFANSQGLLYRFNNGVPNQFTELSGVFGSQWRTRQDAFYAQDQWTIKRLTIQGALRDTRLELLSVRLHRWLAASNVHDDSRGQGVNFDNLSPRVGATYDVSGTGKTSLKLIGAAMFTRQNGTYLHGHGADVRNRDHRHAQLDGHRWHYVVDSVLDDPAAQISRAPAATFAVSSRTICSVRLRPRTRTALSFSMASVRGIIRSASRCSSS